MALYGPWGSGKTTILKFVKYYLTQELPEAERPIVVDFSPWWFSGQQDLTQRFLDQLAGHLKHEHVSNDALQAIGEFADAIADFPVHIPGVSDLLKTGAKILRAFRDARQKDLTGLKERVEAELLKLGRRIVVILDDIDRLTAEEVRHIFGLFKSVANFPNIIYLLAFDRTVVTKALEPLQDLPKGKEYLEKIVQISLEVPPPEEYMLPQLVGAAIDALSNDTPSGLIDQHDLLNMFAVVSRFLKTPRDCARFSNALLTTYTAVKGEVNFADFIGIEALRVFVPTVYELVVNNPERFAGISSGLGPDKELAAFHQDWIKSVPQDQREVLREVTTRLFPKVAAYWGRPSPNVKFPSRPLKNGFDYSVS